MRRQALRHVAQVVTLFLLPLLFSCSLPNAAEETPTPLADDNLCDVVPADVLHTSLHFSAGQTQYWHRASGDNAYDRWECTLVSVDDRQRIGIEYINLDHWTTPAGTFSSPLRDPTLVPEDDKEDHSTPITLPGHEGQGWMIGRSPDPQARTVLAWQYPNGYYLIVSMRYEEGAPAPDNNAQALQDLAVAVIDRIPPIAAGPDQEFTIHPDDQST